MTRWLRIGLATVICSYALLPLYWMVLSAVRPPQELSRVPPSWLPSSISLTNFTEIWSALPLARYLANSALVAAGTALLAVTVSALAAYSIVRYRSRWSGPVMAFVLFTLTVPTIVILVPFYQLLTTLGLLETRSGLALSYSVWAIPFNTLLLRGYFHSAYPTEIEEAALVDGCSRLSVLWRIVLPLSRPGLLAAATFTVLLAWNEFLWASVITTGDDVRTATVGIQLFVGQYGNNENLGLWMAAAVCLTVPVVVGFLTLQKHLVTAYSGVGR
jgi:multiple sugar transport system permease protein